MAKIKDIIDKIEKSAPLETQEEWDNSGWQINLNLKSVDNVLVALNINENTVNQAINARCGLIISHHPLFFQPIKSIKDKAVIKAIQHNIQIYSAHTNFDKAKNGTTSTLLKTLEKPLGLEKPKDINPYVKTAVLKNPMDTKEFTNKLKEALNLKTVRISKPARQIKKIALCAGAGGDFINGLKGYGTDCYVSADIKYHQALECDIMLVDIGHFESEVISLNTLAELIKTSDVNVIISREEPVFETV